MALDASDVSRIAHLARLSVTGPESAEVAARLGSILAMVDRLQAVETSGIAPMAHPLDAVQPLRPDTVTEANRRDDYQRIAPATEAGLYLVPRVIE